MRWRDEQQIGPPLTLCWRRSRAFLGFCGFLLGLALLAPQITTAASLLPKKDAWPSFEVAQVDEESYDPFSDYSEFDEDSEEEADVYFFKHGRLMTIGLVGGYKGFTDNLASIYNSGGTYGIYLAYFFDLRFALQLGFGTGSYNFVFSTPANQQTTGTVSFTSFLVSLKYYLNTQNINQGVADLNPYLIFGIEDVFRTYTIALTTTGGVSNATSSAFGAHVGAGIEIPIMKRKAYFGIQGMYHYLNFADANSAVYLYDFGTNASQVPYGFQYDVLGILGFNF